MFLTGLVSSGSRLRRAMHKLGLAVALASGLAAGSTTQARDSHQIVAESVSLAVLPPEARGTHRLITQGGPYPYAKDGTVFGNRERQLPPRLRGHYREYTVKTPGARDRGARRIVCGGPPPDAPDSCFYTDNHYASFRRITP